VAAQNQPQTQAGTGAGSDAREKSRKRTLIGVVTSDTMNKTRVVMVERRISHHKYGKFLTRRKKFKAHDEQNQYRVGDKVVIVETRPISREKRWKVERLIERPQEV